MEQRFETEQREEARKDAMLKEKLQDAKAVAEREQQAALEREKELAIARVKQRALQAIAKQRQHMQAEEDLAHERKVEVLKEKRLAAKEAAELRLEQRMHTSARGPTDAGITLASSCACACSLCASPRSSYHPCLRYYVRYYASRLSGHERTLAY